MKNTLKALGFSVLGVLYFGHLRGQTFEAVDTLKVDGIENVSMKWIDLDGNLLYDLLLYGSDSLGKGAAQVYLNEGDGNFTLQVPSFPNVKIWNLQPIDYDRDGRIDLAFSGVVNDADSVVSVLVAGEGLSFELVPTPVLSGAVESFELLDLNYDTRPDLLLCQRSSPDSVAFRLMMGTELGFEELPVDFPVFEQARFFAVDIDSDSRKDLLLSGAMEGRSLTRVYRNLGNFEWEEKDNYGFEYEYAALQADTTIVHTGDHRLLRVAVGEYDADGRPDLFVQGTTAEGGEWNVLYRNSDSGFVVDQDSLLPGYQVWNSHMADFDSDGKTDLWLNAVRNDSTFIFWHGNLAAYADTVGAFRDSLLLTEFADFDLDFNLDYAELRQGTAGLQLVLFENQADSVNRGPNLPLPQVAVQTASGEVKISWQPSLDSLTSSSSLSYDVILTGADTIPLVDSNMGSRSFGLQQPYHGNALYSGSLHVNGLPEGDYLFLVRGVDNAYNALAGGGAGGFQLFRFAICNAALVSAEVTLCPQSPEVFGEAGVERNWYSDLYGALGQTDLLSYSASGDDVLYGTVVDVGDCSKGQLVYTISTKPLEPLSDDVETLVQVCEESEITYEVPATWTNVVWTSAALGVVGEGPVLTLSVYQADTLTVVAENEFGCTDTAESIIAFFNPQVADTLITISPGESAELVASGGSAYEWTPAGEFDNPYAHLQLVSPDETTDYQVLIKNEAGCSRLFNITVEVAQLGGVANLFSPNGDNRNDTFFLQLSAVPATIDFRVYARSGGLVYHELDVARAVNEGWDGTHNGQKMPPGVYYWRVEGTYNDGKPVLLNGSKSGKINLVR